MRNLKLQISLSTILCVFFLLSCPATSSAAFIQNLNGQTGTTQSFQNDSNIIINSNNDMHVLGWNGYLPVSRGGTGVGSFAAGSVLFTNGTAFAQDNSNFFWDNVNKRLGIGTNSPTANLDVSGSAKVTTLTSTNDSIINELTVGKGGGTSLYSTAVGVNALSGNTTGPYNTAVGYYALSSNTSTQSNTAFGHDTLRFSTSDFNTAVGSSALGYGNSSLGKNTAVGSNTLSSADMTGSSNAAFGYLSLLNNTTGTYNVAVGSPALEANTSGSNNVAIGQLALNANTTGLYNTVLGYYASTFQADGNSLLTTPNYSVYLGANTKGYDNNDSNSIVIGYNTIGAGTNKTVIGNSNMTDIYFGSSSANADVHAKKIYLGDSSTPGCIIMGDVNGGLVYLTVVSGSLTVSTTAPAACQ